MGQNHMVFQHRFKNAESFARSDGSKCALSVVVISLKEKIRGGRLEQQKVSPCGFQGCFLHGQQWEREKEGV